MPRVTDYTGNAGLGLGSNPQIPVSNQRELNAIEQSGRDAMLLNVQQQRTLFEQKKKDHDQLLNLISSGDLKVGDMLERDMPVIKKSFDALDEAWRQRGKKGFNDIDAAVAYNKALREAQDTITQAQARKVVDTQVQGEAAKQEDEDERTSMLGEHEGYLGNFWGDYKPHVKAATLDHPGMTETLLKDALVPNAGITGEGGTTHRYTIRSGSDGKLTRWDTYTNKPVAGAVPKGAKIGQPIDEGLSMFQTIPGKYYDYDKILTNTADAFHDFKQRKNMQLYQDFLLKKMDDFQLKTTVDAANERFKVYNEQRGLKPGDKGFVGDMRVGIDDEGKKQFFDDITVVGPDGQPKRSNKPLSITETNARLALAAIPGDYVEADKKVLDKDAANYLIAQQKADADEMYKRMMAGAAGTRARAYAANLRNQMKHRDTAAEQNQFLNEMWQRNLLNQTSLIDDEVTPLGRKDIYKPIEADKSLPVFTLEGGTVKQLVPIGGEAVYPTGAYDANGVLKPGSKPLYYKGGHFEQSYQLNGKDIDPSQMTRFYNIFKGQYEKQTGTPWEGGIDKFLKESIKNDRFRVLLRGANGTSDQDLSRAAQMIISNKNTTKGEEGVFEYQQEYIPDNQQ